jgi:hypothetical protein
MGDLNITSSTLDDLVQRYRANATASVSTNNSTPDYVRSILSAVETAHRRIFGRPSNGNYGDFTWLTAGNVQGKNLDLKLRPLFDGQESVNSKPPLAVTTTRKNIDSYRAALYAVGKHVSQLDVLPQEYKKELLKDLMEQEKAPTGKLYTLNDKYHAAVKKHYESGELSKRQAAKQSELNLDWPALVKKVADGIVHLEAALDTEDSYINSQDFLQTQQAMLLVLVTLIPPLRTGAFKNMRLITPEMETEEELLDTKTPNYILISDTQVELVVNMAKNDRRTDDADYDPSVNMPPFDLPRGSNEFTLRLQLERCDPPTDTDSGEVIQEKKHCTNVINTLEKYGFQPTVLANLLRKYLHYMTTHFSGNDKQYLFVGRNNLKAIKNAGDRLRDATLKLYDVKLGTQDLRPMFRTWLNSQVVPIEDNRLIADCMQHSIETAMGKYTKKRSPPKRLGADAQQGSGQRRRIAAEWSPSGALPSQSDAFSATALRQVESAMPILAQNIQEELVASGWDESMRS